MVLPLFRPKEGKEHRIELKRGVLRPAFDDLAQLSYRSVNRQVEDSIHNSQNGTKTCTGSGAFCLIFLHFSGCLPEDGSVADACVRGQAHSPAIAHGILLDEDIMKEREHKSANLALFSETLAFRCILNDQREISEL